MKDGQTIATHDLDIAGGQATLDLMATPNMAGTVELNAYLFGHDARAVADHSDPSRLRGQVSGRCGPGTEARVAVRLARNAVLRGAEMPLQDGLRLEQDLASLVYTTDDAREGPLAFLEKRAPQWQGR